MPRVTRMRWTLPALAGPLLLLATAGSPRGDIEAPVVLNDNLVPAGKLAERELTIRLEVRWARWHPLGAERAGADILAFGEEGGEPQIPGPLLRVPLGTVMRVRVTNTTDITLVLRGLSSRRLAVMDSLLLGPGASAEARFAADAEGTHYYWAGAPGVSIENRAYDDSQLHGAFVVDPPAARDAPRDRILILSGWVQARDSAGDPDPWTELFTINGRPWPHTERFTLALGDSVHWRVLNLSLAPHPMHLHGFYYGVEARGDGMRDTLYWPAQQRMVVTEKVDPGTTMRMVWSPDRPGGWIFHCHLNWHVIENPRLGAEREATAVRIRNVIAGHPDHDPWRHVESGMGGLMVGMYVPPPAGWTGSSPGRRSLRLFVQSDSTPADTVRRFGYVLQGGEREPAPDSVRVPGSTLVLQRGEPTSIWVINRSGEPTQVHWHGLELESPFDGVAGVGGYRGSPTPPIMPGDSFEVRVTPPRAGSYMYHTHINDIRQQSGGLWGALLVLEPDQRWDPARDRILMLGETLDFDQALYLPAEHPPLELRTGVPYRFRLMNITMGGPNLEVWLLRDGSPIRWIPLARDGHNLPPWQRLPTRSRQLVGIGETHDFQVRAQRPGDLTLEVRRANGAVVSRRQVVVR